MAVLAFVLAPRQAIPPTADRAWEAAVTHWSYASDERWEQLRERNPALAKKVPAWLGGPRLSRNLAAAMGASDKTVRASARAWTEALWERLTAGAPDDTPTDNGLVTAQEVLGIASRVSTEDLTAYRGGFKPIAPKKLPRGAALGFAVTARDPYGFPFAERDMTDRVILEEIARAHGGDHLAVWTFGHAAHVWLARSPAPGARPKIHGPFSFRAHPAGRGDDLDALRAALAGATITPDLDACARLLAAPTLSLTDFCALFGATGATDISPPDAAALWADFDAVRAQVRDGAEVDTKALARVNAVIEPAREKLPKKAPKKGDPDAPFARPAIALGRAVGFEGRAVPAQPPPDTDDARYRDARNARAMALLDHTPAPQTLARFSDLASACGRRLRYEGRLSEEQGGVVALRVRLPRVDAVALRALRADLQGDNVIGSYGEAWIEPDGVAAVMCSDLDTAMLASVLGDLPPGTRVDLAVGPERAMAFVRGGAA